MEEKKEVIEIEAKVDNETPETVEPKKATPEEWNTIAGDIRKVGYVAVLVDAPETPSIFTKGALYEFAGKHDFALLFLPKHNWALVAVTINEIPVYLYRQDKKAIHRLLYNQAKPVK